MQKTSSHITISDYSSDLLRGMAVPALLGADLILTGRSCELGGETAALGCRLALSEYRKASDAPVREFLPNLNSTLSRAAAPTGERPEVDDANVLPAWA